MSATERTVRVGLMSYVDPEGAHRVALKGAVVEVHPDSVARFDRLNRLQGDPESAPTEAPPEAPKRRGRPRKVTTEE